MGKSMIRGFFAGVFFLASISFGYCQSATVLENNPNLAWRQINTPNFNIVFPKGFETQAQRMANTMEHIRTPEAKSLGVEPRKISMILQNQSAVSNGFVSITPRRSEFFGMPSQNYNFVGNLDWLNLLATHEYRHIVQFQHANRGFNRALYYLFGANTLAAMSYAAVPQWFWEGDAVATETAFTSGGRGRIPNFNLLFRTNLQEGRVFNYNKQYLRSYKHNIPDHYVLGYNMVSYLRKKTGDADSWGNITRRAWSVPFLPYTFSRSIKKETGLYVSQLYKEMTTELQKEWREQLANTTLTTFETINKRSSKAYTDYRYPHEVAAGVTLALKSGIGDIEQFVILSDGKEKRIMTPGNMNASGMLSVACNRIVWNEYRYDPRWRVRTYSVLMGYDLKEKSRKVISLNSRYAAAALSPDGTKVATIETSTDYQTKLVILSYESGLVLQTFDNPNNDFISMPRWAENGNEIVALATNKNGKAIVKFDLSSKQRVDLTDFTSENIGYPVPYQKYILYNSPRSGIDNIYALDVVTGNYYQITSSAYGSYNPSVSKDGKTLLYNEQGRDGLDVAKATFDPSQWKVVEKFTALPDIGFQHLVEEEAHPDLLKSIPTENFPVSKYSRFGHAINIYNWGAYVDNSLTNVEVGVSSRDVLSTTAISAGYNFDINERTGSWKAGLSYQGLYPIVDVNFSKATRSVNEGDVQTQDWFITQQKDTTIVKSIKNITFDWKEENIEVGIRIPLITTRSKYLSSVSFSNYIGYTHVTDFRNSETQERYFPAITRYDTITQNGNLAARRSFISVYPFFNYAGNGNLIYNNFNFSAYRLLKQSRRDINSKWGQALLINLYNTPYGGDLGGGLFSLTGYMYLPGLAKHHSLWGYWAYQNTLVHKDFSQAFDDYLFRNKIPLPRGQSVSRYKEFYSMSLNYTMPIWYPDLNIGPLVNFQRVRTNFFMDYGFGRLGLFNGNNQSYLSVGGEMKFDINILRLLPQMDIGFRYSYGISPSATKFEFLIGTFNF
jgi:hypothetical protein